MGAVATVGDVRVRRGLPASRCGAPSFERRDRLKPGLPRVPDRVPLAPPPRVGSQGDHLVGSHARGPPSGFPSHHRLLDLWGEAKGYVVACGDPAAPELANVEANLGEFATIDPGADGFRYALNQKQTASSLPNTPEYVNLQLLHDAMVALANFLAAVSSALTARLDEAAGIDAAMRHLHGLD